MTTTPPPRLSLVIVNYDSWPDVLAQVAVLAESAEMHSGVVEAIVVDNHSPTPANRPELHGLTWLDMPDNGGFAAGVNAGWHAAQGEWLLLLNPDVKLETGTLGHVLALLDEIQSLSFPQRRIGVAGVGLTNPDGSRQPSVGAFPTALRGILELFLPRNRRRYQIGFTQKPGPVDWVTGAFCLVRAEAMRQLGGFDTDFFLYFEETDFCRRARDHAWLTWFDPRLKLCHQKPLQNRAVSPMIRLWTRHSRLLYFRKNRPRLEFQIMLRVVRLEAALKARLARLGLGDYPPAIWNAIHELTTDFAQHREPLGTEARDWALQVAAEALNKQPG